MDTYKILAVYCVGQARENDTLNQGAAMKMGKKKCMNSRDN